MSEAIDKPIPPRPKLMGILNVTPDSFSDGGEYLSVERAVQRAQRMSEEGADIIDVGGESTRPGSERVEPRLQLERVLPVIERLREALPGHVRISIDTTSSLVARAALEAGAHMINDISAGRDDPAVLDVAAKTGAELVLMHMQGTPATMQDNPQYDDVVDEVLGFLMDRAAAAEAAGVAREAILVDPGIGFGKTRLHNLRLLEALPRFVGTGYRVLLGASRKRFMGSVCGESEPRALVPATCATTALGVAAGVSVFRVHDVKENRQAADVAWAIRHPF